MSENPLPAAEHADSEPAAPTRSTRIFEGAAYMPIEHALSDKERPLPQSGYQPGKPHFDVQHGSFGKNPGTKPNFIPLYQGH